MKKTKILMQSLLCGLLLMAGVAVSHGQTVLYEENMGTPTSATLIQNYTGWQNTEVLYIGDGTCDVRTSSASAGYGLASGGGNVMLNDTVKWFQISGISTLGANSPTLYLGLRKTTSEDGSNLRVMVSADSVTWIPLTLSDSLPVGTGTSGWYRVHYSALPVGARLHLRFSNMATSDYRLDDIAVVDGEEQTLETVATPVITPSSGLYYEPQTVAIACATDGAQIYYTTDGSTPTADGPLFGSPFVVDHSLTVKAMAVKADMYDSDISTVNIQIQDTNSLVHLPFDISTNSTDAHEDIAMMSGFRGYYLGSSYADGSAKFEASNAGRAALVAHLDDAPQFLTFEMKGKTGGSAPVAYEGIEMEVSQSADGQSWSVVGLFSETDIPVTDYAHITGIALSPDTRYLRWKLNAATKGNTQLNNIVITKYEAPTDTTGILDYLQTPVACYPNPTNGSLTVLYGSLQVQSMSLTDICGHEVRSWSAPVPKTLSLTGISEGTYVLTIVTSEGELHTKIVKY